MTIEFQFTPGQVATSTVAALRYQSVLARIVNRDIDAHTFVPGAGSTVTVKRPSVVDPARTYTEADRAAGDGITFSDLIQPYASVDLRTQVYNAVKLPDDVVEFDIESLEREVIAPMGESVADRLNGLVAEALYTTPAGLTTLDGKARGKFVATDGVAYDTVSELRAAGKTFEGIGVGTKVKAAGLTAAAFEDIPRVIRTARRLFEDRKVPRSNRYLVVGSAWEQGLIAHGVIAPNTKPSDGSLGSATLGSVSGFTVVVDADIDAYDAFAYHRDGITLATRVKAAPRGASFAAIRAAEGFSIRYIHSYDAKMLEDQAVLDTFAGAEVLDPQRIIRLTGTEGFEEKVDPTPVVGG